MKKYLLTPFLVTLLVLLGGTQAWAEETTLMEYGTATAPWTDATLAEWTAGGTPTLADGVVTITGKNGSYATSKTITPEEKAILKVSAVWRGRSNTGRAFSAGNGSYFRFGNIIVAQNDQDKKHGYGFTGLGNIKDVTTFTAGSYRVDISSCAWLLIEMEINTDANILKSFTIKSEDGNTTYVNQTNVALTDADYTTVAFGYRKSGSVSTTNTEQLKSVVVKQTIVDIEMADYTVNYKYEGNTIKTVNGNDAVGITVDVAQRIEVDGVKYKATEGQTESFELVSGANNYDINVILTPNYSYTVNAVYNGQFVKQLATGTEFEAEEVTVNNLPILNTGKSVIYKDGYSYKFTMTEDNQVENVEFTSIVDNAAFFSEAEDIATLTPVVSEYLPEVFSNGKGAYAAGEAKVITTLKPGTYKLYAQILGTNSECPFAFKAGENAIWSNTTTAASSARGNGVAGAQFVLYEPATITLEAGGGDGAADKVTNALDFVYITQEASADIELLPSILTFPTYNVEPVASYTSTWYVNQNNALWKFEGFNNNNNAWEYVGCGRKKADQVATITTPIVTDAEPVVQLALNIKEVANLKSAKIVVMHDGLEDNTIDITSQFVPGELIIPIEDGAQNSQYQIVIESNAGENGCIQISKIALYADGQYTDGATLYYKEDFEKSSDISAWKSSTAGRYTPVYAADAEGNHYLSVNQDERYNNGCVVSSTILSNVIEADMYDFTVTFDMMLGNTNNQLPTFQLCDAAGNDILNLKASATNGTLWTLNGTPTEIDLPNSGYDKNTRETITWCSYIITCKDGLTYLTITNKETGETIFPRTIIDSKASGGLGVIKFATARYFAFFAIDNIVVRSVSEKDVPDLESITNLIINYVDENGEQLAESLVIPSTVGAEATANSDQAAASMMVGEQKYLYKEGNKTITLVKDETENVITLVYRPANDYTYRVLAVTDGGLLLQTLYRDAALEADDVPAKYPLYVNYKGTLYTKAANNKVYTENFTLKRNNQPVNLIYEATTIKKVVFAAEGENIEGTTAVADTRSSFGASAYADENVTIVKLTAGDYTINAVGFFPAETEDKVLITDGTNTILEIAGSNNAWVAADATFTLTEDTDIILAKGSANAALDFLYIQSENGGIWVDPATGISAVKADFERNAVYNLNGQKVERPAKGLYIVNGKKVVIK